MHRPHLPHQSPCLWDLSLFQNLSLVNRATNKHGCTRTCDIHCLETFKKIQEWGIWAIPYHNDIRSVSSLMNSHIYFRSGWGGSFTSHWQYERVPFHILWILSLSPTYFNLTLLPVNPSCLYLHPWFCKDENWEPVLCLPSSAGWCLQSTCKSLH